MPRWRSRPGPRCLLNRGGLPRVLKVWRDVLGMGVSVTAMTQTYQVVWPMRLVWLLAVIAGLNMMHRQAIANVATTTGAASALQRDDTAAAGVPCPVMQQVSAAFPVMRERANLFSAVQALTIARTEPHSSIVFLSDAQDPRLQGECPSAFFTDQGHRLDPFCIRPANVLALFERGAVGVFRALQQDMQTGQSVASTRTILLAGQQARLDAHRLPTVAARQHDHGPYYIARNWHRGDAWL